MTSPSSAAGTTSTAMAIRYPLVACHAWERLPDPAQTASGMMATMQKMTAEVFRKVDTWR